MLQEEVKPEDIVSKLNTSEYHVAGERDFLSELKQLQTESAHRRKGPRKEKIKVFLEYATVGPIGFCF